MAAEARVGAERERKGVMDESYAAGRRAEPAIHYRYRVRALEAAEAIKRNLNPSRRLKCLDLGSADGSTLQEIARALPFPASFTGIEHSGALVARAGQLGPHIRVVRGDMAALPAAIKNASYDVVTALASLEHLESPAIALREAAKALKRGGLMVATCPEPFWDRLATRLGLLEDHHESYVSRRSMLEGLELAGMESIEYRRFMWAPVGFLPYVGVRVAPPISLAVDAGIRRLHLLNWLFINQLWVGQKL
jgi:SAM-dependent methyltransferase